MNKKTFLVSVLAVFFITAMVTVSDLFHEPEIIFPEIAALTIGSWLAPKMSWKTTRVKIALLITVNAFLGIAAVRYINAPVYLKTGALILICYALMEVLDTTFAPMICAAVLPVYLGTTSFIYPVSASLMAFTVSFLQYVLERTGIRQPESPASAKSASAQSIFLRLKQWSVLMLIAFIPVTRNYLFIIAPPLIVGFTELSTPDSGTRKRPVKLVVLTCFAAVLGTASRYIFTVNIGLPIGISALIVSAVLVFAVQRSRLFFPPAGAIAILPLLVDEGQLLSYPIKVTGGFCILTISAMYLFRPKNPVNNSLSE